MNAENGKWLVKDVYNVVKRAARIIWEDVKLLFREQSLQTQGIMMIILFTMGVAAIMIVMAVVK